MSFTDTVLVIIIDFGTIFAMLNIFKILNTLNTFKYIKITFSKQLINLVSHGKLQTTLLNNSHLT